MQPGTDLKRSTKSSPSGAGLQKKKKKISFWISRAWDWLVMHGGRCQNANEDHRILKTLRMRVACTQVQPHAHTHTHTHTLINLSLHTPALQRTIGGVTGLIFLLVSSLNLLLSGGHFITPSYFNLFDRRSVRLQLLSWKQRRELRHSVPPVQSCFSSCDEAHSLWSA